MAIEWDEAWNIGHAKIDEQHQNWVKSFNRLEGAVLSDDAQRKEMMQKQTMEEIVRYTDYHFSTEESLMKEVDYPESASHWRLHKNFKNVLYEHSRNFLEGKLILNTQILSLIRRWLVEHIQTEDQKLGKFLRSRKR
jgi:hemerythrin-like metal-binding protein